MQQVKVSVVHLTLFRTGPFPSGHSSLPERPWGRNHIGRLREPKDSSEIATATQSKDWLVWKAARRDYGAGIAAAWGGLDFALSSLAELTAVAT